MPSSTTLSAPGRATSSAGPTVTVTRLAGPNRALRLAQQGFAIERGLLGTDEVSQLRRAVDAAIDDPAQRGRLLTPPGCGSILPDVFRLPAVYPRLFTPRSMAALTSLLGPGFVLLPEHAVHRNGFGGWHKDTNMFEDAGRMGHWSSDYGVYQVAIYLQDNNAQTGGGLSVVPGSHQVPRPSAKLPDAAQRYEAHTRRYGVPLDSRAGDLVVFHTRLDHRATPMQRTPGGAKLALFFIAALDNHHAGSYNEFIHRRKDYTYLRGYEVPPDMLALARAGGFRFAE